MRTFRPLAVLLPVLLSGCLYRAAWLPDGTHIAYLRSGALWITDLAGHHVRIADAPASDITVSAAPSGGLLALAGTFDGVRALKVMDTLGTLRWSISLPGSESSLLPGCWAPDAGQILVPLSSRQVFVCDIQSGDTTRLNSRGGPARFLDDGELVWLAGDGKDGWTLERRKKGIVFREPAGDDAEPLWLTGDAGKVWWRVRTGGGARIVLAGPDGKPVFQSDRGMAAPGPDPLSFVTTDAGYAIIRSGAPAVNLNPLYNRLLKMDLDWQLADPKTAGDAYDARDLLASTPAFSPDGTKVAILTPHLLAVGNPATGEVVALSKW